MKRGRRSSDDEIVPWEIRVTLNPSSSREFDTLAFVRVGCRKWMPIFGTTGSTRARSRSSSTSTLDSHTLLRSKIALTLILYK
jgi:hypothetical protein